MSGPARADVDPAPSLLPAAGADLMTRSGATVHVRAVRADDEARLTAFYQGLSDRARALRFCAAVNDDFLIQAAGRYSMLKDTEGFGLMATERDDERVIAHAVYLRTGADRAEVAFAVADDRHDRGLGTLLLGELAQIASARGIREFEALVLPENRQMLAVFRESGFPIRTRAAGRRSPGGVPHRAERGGARALRAPGVDRRGECGRRVLSSADGGGDRRVAASAARSAARCSTICWPTGSPVRSSRSIPTLRRSRASRPIRRVEDIPGPVDLAVIIVPAARVLEVAKRAERRASGRSS